MEKIKGELNYLDTYLTELKEKTGFHAEELEYGPGLLYRIFKAEKRIQRKIYAYFRKQYQKCSIMAGLRLRWGARLLLLADII